MTDFWFAIFSGAGFIYLINNFNVFNIKNSLAETYMNNTYISSCTKWKCFKLYAIAKEKSLKTIQYVKKSLKPNTISKNILFVNNGERETQYYINTNKTSSTLNTIPENLENFDLIIYRAPSSIDKFDYDLLRLTQDSEKVKNNTDISYNVYSDKIYSPEISFENSNETYDLDIEKDNYFVVGNKIFDLPFVKWIVKEKYKKDIPEENYTITYLDENMNENTIKQNEYLVIKKDSIIKEVDNTASNDNNNDNNELVNKSESGWGLW